MKKNVLRERLPEYDPPEVLWHGLEEKLDKDRLLQLPDYTPGEQVWAAIEQHLEAPEIRAGFRRYLSVAAAVVLLMLTGAWLLFYYESSTIEVYQEALDPRLQIDESSQADYQFDRLMEVCLLQKDVCVKPDFTRLRAEYEHLRAAAGQVQQAAGRFNHDPGLMEEYDALEHQKALLLNELAKFI